MGFLSHVKLQFYYNYINFPQDYYIEFQICYYEPFMTFEKLEESFSLRQPILLAASFP